MKELFSKFLLWIYLKIHFIMSAISVALFNTEEEILRANPNDLDEKNNYTQRMYHRNSFVEMMLSGIKDDIVVRKYYELLKKADKFMLNSDTHQMGVAGDKWGMNVGIKDKYGRRYDHVGFFDGKHKNAGKTMKEVLEDEIIERRTTDDDYELLAIINNKPIETGLSKIDDVIDDEFNLVDMANKSKTFEFPIKIQREEIDKDGNSINVINKIEQLTEFLHVKKIGFEHRQFEFFIPLKFGTKSLPNDGETLKEIINIKNIYIHDKYGELVGFRVDSFNKRIIYNDSHEVWKFHGIEMETIK